MRLIIIIVIVLSLLGLGVWWMFIREAPHEVFVEENKETGQVDKFNLDPQFVRLDPIVVPVIDGGQLMSNIGVIVTLEVKNKDIRDEVLFLRQKIRLAFFKDLKLIVRGYGEGDKLDLNLVKYRFLKTARKMLGHETVDRILIVNDLYLPLKE